MSSSQVVSAREHLSLCVPLRAAGVRGGAEPHSFSQRLSTTFFGLEEGPILAASRTASTGKSTGTSNIVTSARTASGRLSFAKIREPLEVPDLLALQTESFDWLLVNERWQARVAEAKAAGRGDVPDRSGLEEIFEDRKSTRLNSSHSGESRMPSSA